MSDIVLKPSRWLSDSSSFEDCLFYGLRLIMSTLRLNWWILSLFIAINQLFILMNLLCRNFHWHCQLILTTLFHHN